jgi:hypothetical protein
LNKIKTERTLLGMLKRNLLQGIIWFGLVLSFSLQKVGAADTQPSRLLHVFADFPASGLTQIPCFPTPNTHVDADHQEGFAARIRTNELYGMPGWTRDMGERFHKGVDIVPIHFEKLDKTVKIDYYDPKTKKSFVEYEAVVVPKDEIYAVLDGAVIVANKEEQRSGYGRYIMIQHKFKDGTPFLSMYAHLSKVDVNLGDQVHRGDHIAWMGNTSSSPGGRMYLRFVPHCHFEIGRIINNSFTTTRYAKILFPLVLGGNADPRNVQPYDPIDFLKTFKAESRSELLGLKDEEPGVSKPDVFQSSSSRAQH